jgi:hypothetical protein
MAYVLRGGIAIGVVLTLAFLPPLYAMWFRVNDVDAVRARGIKPAMAVADLVYEPHQ